MLKLTAKCAGVLLAIAWTCHSSQVSSEAARPSLTREDLEAWLDGYMPYALKSGDVAGAMVVVVKDDQVLLEKGCGYADTEERLPVDALRTVFRPGSTS